MTINYFDQLPTEPLNDFVFTFWKTHNNTDSDYQYTILPDAGIELIISLQPERPNQMDLFGLSTHSLDITIPKGGVLFGVRFKLLAVEYLLKTTLPTNSIQKPSTNFWDVEVQAQTPLDRFVNLMSALLEQQLKLSIIDPRKRKLSEFVYNSKGAVSVHDLALETGWSTRQINRYFRATVGLPLKRYLEQLQFFSSLSQIGQGEFYPLAYYYDQSHFIRQTKKHTGSTPKQLYQQRAVRFVQVGQYTEE
ncbi:helix-turn-helix domain-containing protein [Spirosoma foliorum]|uniref:Helix-turn-helix transcriptional regulator n=1 Tax=Spirosoma foliorum TaxID=2710596 RepID=A0A7G5GUF4_9BACT|nr:AraC family transcriptional regulator [Spirosoma foliorum]QMW02496.1 helix-turn-helix transcriptional regulator [Spirosoma foliorum]